MQLSLAKKRCNNKCFTKEEKKNKTTETTFSNLSDLTDELANTNHSNTEDCHVASGAPVGTTDACPQQPANCRVLNGRPKGSMAENKRKKEMLLHSLKREICEEWKAEVDTARIRKNLTAGALFKAGKVL